MELEERFWSKAKWDAPPGECWEWLGVKNQKGYGMFKINRETCMAHRLAYELERAPLPPWNPTGPQADHLCRNKSCVNPWHIEIVSPRLNNQRRSGSSDTHCGRGHERTAANSYTQKSNGRLFCALCRRINEETRQSKRRLK